MFSFSKEQGTSEIYGDVTERLKELYKVKLLPLEKYHHFHDFHAAPLEDADFDSKPLLLVVGQYSTGKTSFIRYLLGQDFPGMRVGPEPTSDKFVILMQGKEETVIPGHTLVVDTRRQFKSLSEFGNALLNKLQCSLMNSAVLEHLTIIDTPGILSSGKELFDCGYDFINVLVWFAERADRIILFFDVHKLDVSSELKRFIMAIKHHEEKIRFVLNKSDTIEDRELLRVYGSLMWSLSRVLVTPEVVRVYIGSFWGKPFRCHGNRKLFEDDEQDLFTDLESLPKYSLLRKLNDFVKRAHLAKTHAYVIDYLKKENNQVFGQDSKKRELLQNLNSVCHWLQKEHHIPEGDFPNVNEIKVQLLRHDFKFNPIKNDLINVVDSMLASDIVQLMSVVCSEQLTDSEMNSKGRTCDEWNPFSSNAVLASGSYAECLVGEQGKKYTALFQNLKPVKGKVSGDIAKVEMMKSKLPKSVLGKIWNLADMDGDGYLDAFEFSLAMYLIDAKLNGFNVPSEVPQCIKAYKVNT